MDTILQALINIRMVEEKFVKIQENPSLNGAEYGLSANEEELLRKLIDLCGEINLAADAISKRALGFQETQ